MKTTKNYLKEKRLEIDKLDEKIAYLLLERKFLISDIGTFKKNNNINIEDKDREKLLLKKIGSYGNNPSEKNYLVSVFKDIIKASKKIQEDIK